MATADHRSAAQGNPLAGLIRSGRFEVSVVRKVRKREIATSYLKVHAQMVTLLAWPSIRIRDSIGGPESIESDKHLGRIPDIRCLRMVASFPEQKRTFPMLQGFKNSWFESK